MSTERAYKVFKIENGTVIDHIKSPLALKIIEILHLQNNGIISIGMNFDSDKTAKKDIIKVENVYLSKTETDLIALFSPTATINIIKNGEVIEKRLLEKEEKHKQRAESTPQIFLRNFRKSRTAKISELAKSTVVFVFAPSP